MRTIKKYPNRRLYDTERSKYITLADLRQLIFDGEEFEVVDANSGEDITRAILLQIINDQESEGQPLFTTEILTQLIRFYGGETQGIFSRYLAKSLDLFVQQQNFYQDSIKDAMSKSPMVTFSELTQKNMEIWQDLQASFLKSAGLDTRRSKNSDDNKG